MRVLHVTPSFAPAWAYGGIPRCAFELCQALVRRGDDVTVWTTDVLDEMQRVTAREATLSGIRVHYFPNVSNALAYQRQLYLPRGLWAHARRHYRDFDVIHVHSHRHAMQAMIWALAGTEGPPFVFTGNGTVPRIERYLMAKRVVDLFGAQAFLGDAAACIAVADAEVPDYIAAGADPDRIVVIPNGFTLEDFHRLPPPGHFRQAHGLDGAPLVVFVGKITPRKGLDVLLQALARMPAAVHLAVAGNFMMPQEPIRQLVRDLGLGDRVCFAGLLVEEDKLAAYVDADVVAYPSEKEIFGLVVGEALLCGAAVVVCDDSGCGQLVRDSGGGLLVPYGDAGALAAALQTLLDDQPRREAFVTIGRRFVEDHLGWDTIAAVTQDLYRHVVRGDRHLARRVRGGTT